MTEKTTEGAALKIIRRLAALPRDGERGFEESGYKADRLILDARAFQATLQQTRKE